MREGNVGELHNLLLISAEFKANRQLKLCKASQLPWSSETGPFIRVSSASSSLQTPTSA